MGGDKPIGLAIGIVVVGALVALPAGIVLVFYPLATLHAIFVGSDFGSDTMNVGVFLTLLAVSVVLLLVVMAALVTLVGRALSPKNREG